MILNAGYPAGIPAGLPCPFPDSLPPLDPPPGAGLVMKSSGSFSGIPTVAVASLGDGEDSAMQVSKT